MRSISQEQMTDGISFYSWTQYELDGLLPEDGLRLQRNWGCQVTAVLVDGHAVSAEPINASTSGTLRNEPLTLESLTEEYLQTLRDEATKRGVLLSIPRPSTDLAKTEWTLAVRFRVDPSSSGLLLQDEDREWLLAAVAEVC